MGTKSFLEKVFSRIKKIGNIKKTGRGRELLIFFVFLLASTFAWYLQTLQYDSEFEVKVPLSYSKLPDSVSITNDLPKELKVLVRDKAKNAYKYYGRKSERTIVVNLMNWYVSDGISSVSTNEFRYEVQKNLLSTSKLIKITQDSLNFYFITKSSKIIPVIFDGKIMPSTQYMVIKEPELKPSHVKIYAPSKILDKIYAVHTVAENFVDVNKSFTSAIKLREEDGIQYSENSVNISVEIEEFTEKKINIPVKGYDFPENLGLIIRPASVTVSFFVGLSSYKNISGVDFEVGVDYNQFLKSDNSNVPVQIKKCPNNISNLKVTPQSVYCLMETK